MAVSEVGSVDSMLELAVVVVSDTDSVAVVD